MPDICDRRLCSGIWRYSRRIVESAQAAPGGALFSDLQGTSFQPNALADRLTAAIVLVRAAGLRSEAEAQANAPLSLTDAASIPAQWRGYVAVALARGLLKLSNNAFRPQATLTRLELANALVRGLNCEGWFERDVLIGAVIPVLHQCLQGFDALSKVTDCGVELR